MCTQVTDDSGISLYVLARNVTQFFSEFDSTVQSLIKEYGYTGLLFGAKKNKQDATCPTDIYSPPWSPGSKSLASSTASKPVAAAA